MPVIFVVDDNDEVYYAHAGKAYFNDGRPLIYRGIYCLRSSPIGSRPIALAISITRLSRCWIAQTRGKPDRQCLPVWLALTRSEPSLLPVRCWSRSGIGGPIQGWVVLADVAGNG